MGRMEITVVRGTNSTTSIVETLNDTAKRACEK